MATSLVSTFGRILSAEEIRAYIQDPNPSINTGFMIFFQGLAIDAWDHVKGTYICMTALVNDCLDSKRYNSEWVKKSRLGRMALYLDSTRNILAHDEVFVEYGNLAFCRINFPTPILFKAIAHYYSQIIASPHDRDLWSRIPQARYLFNTPYHTLQPHQVTKAIDTLQHHHLHCDIRCTCDLQQQLTLISQHCDTKKRPATRPPSARKRHRHTDTYIPIPDSNNYRYDQRLTVLPDTNLKNAGLGLFATAQIKAGEIIGIYENYTGGKRLTAARIKRPSHQSAYAVEHNGLVRDAWNPELQKPCCNTAYSNDPMDANKDNATLAINPNFPMTLLLIATKDIDASPTTPLPIYLPYGSKYWCDDQYPIELHIQAIRRYQINIYTSTEDTDGNWTELRTYPQLCQIFPAMSNSDVNRDAEHPPDSGICPFNEPAALQDSDNKKRTRTATEITKVSRQRTMDAYITRRMPVKNAKGGIAVVNNSLCHDVNVCHDLSVALNNQYLNFEFSSSTSTSINSTIHVPPIEAEIEKQQQHDKRYVFI